MSRAPCRPWRMSEIRALDAAIGSGATLPSGAIPRLARSLGRTEGAIQHALWRRRVALALRRKRPTGKPPAHHRHWSAADIEALDAAIGSGATLPSGAIPRLARSLGRTMEAIRYALWQRRIALGLVRRRNGGGQ